MKLKSRFALKWGVLLDFFSRATRASGDIWGCVCVCVCVWGGGGGGGGVSISKIFALVKYLLGYLNHIYIR